MKNNQCCPAPINPIILGKIGSAYGIYGWFKIFSSTNNIKNIFNYQPWFINTANTWKTIWLESWKQHNHSLIIKVSNIENRELAKQLSNYEIFVDAKQFPCLDNGEYYWKDLVGCLVVTINGYQLGRVTSLMQTGSNDVLIVKTNLKDYFGIRERLIPFLYERVIKNVDLINHVIKVDWDPNF